MSLTFRLFFAILAVSVSAAACAVQPTPVINTAVAADTGTGGDLGMPPDAAAPDAAGSDDAGPGDAPETPTDAVAGDLAAVQDATGDVTPTDDGAPVADTARAGTEPGDAAGGPDAQDDTAADAAALDVASADAVNACPAGKCDDKEPCTVDLCDPGTGACKHEAAAGCGATIACAVAADCAGGACHPATGTCVQCAKGADCGAGFLCVLGACKAAPACQSDAQCKTTKQVCAKAEQLCVDCVDKNDCATGQVCVATQCVAAPKACTSSKDCPSLCDKAQGVCVGCLGHDDCAKDQFCGAGNVCVKDLCSGPQCSGGTIFACKASGGGFDAPKACEDNNPCTDNACQPGPGCVFPPNAAPCSDGNACTDKDVCASGKCAGAGKVDCDDKNPCTDDGCGA